MNFRKQQPHKSTSAPVQASAQASPQANPFAPWQAHEMLLPPGPLLMMMEARAPWEYAAMLAAAPWLNRLPVGDGHPVVVFLAWVRPT